MGRPRDQHLDNRELDALVPSSCETGQKTGELPTAALREAWWHAEACLECDGKVRKYQQLVGGLPGAAVSDAAPAGMDCPELNDDEWREVAAGVWPESKAVQLIQHAALCDHCGPLLRRSVSARDAREETRARGAALSGVPVLSWGRFAWRLVPVLALGLIVGTLGTRPWSSARPISGAKFAELAVNAHRQHAQGKLALDVRSSSQRELNEWLRAKSPFSVALPGLASEVGEERPFDLEGAQLVRVGGSTAAFIAYQVKLPRLQTAAASLIVTPDSVAVASGGVEVAFKKVSFHYATVEGYKVVTWTVHGLTYALVSEEGNSTQRSCMVCHSAMKDRDLSQTPAPLRVERNISQPIWQ